MLILDCHDAENAIIWNEKGDRWKVLSVRKLEMLLPKYFKHRCYASFMRQVNIYGFKRIKTGPDIGSYFHPVRHSCQCIISLKVVLRLLNLGLYSLDVLYLYFMCTCMTGFPAQEAEIMHQNAWKAHNLEANESNGCH